MRPRVAVLLISLVSVLAACAAPSGLVDDFSTFDQIGPKGVYAYTSPDKSLGDYHSFIIETAAVKFNPKTQAWLVRPGEAEELGELVRHELEMALTFYGSYRVTGEPGPGVARLRSAVTGLYPRRSRLNISTPTRIRRLGLDRARLEAEFVDSVTGERLGAYVDARNIERVGRGLEEGLPRPVQVGDIMAGFAKGVRGFLDRARAADTAPPGGPALPGAGD